MLIGNAISRAFTFIRRRSCLAVIVLLASIGGAASAQPTTASAAKPNIVFILVDNLGYGELGVYGGGILRGAPTPRIDKLAGEGTRLLNFNVEAQCTPSRSALMTGASPFAPAPTLSRLAVRPMVSLCGRSRLLSYSPRRAMLPACGGMASRERGIPPSDAPGFR